LPGKTEVTNALGQVTTYEWSYVAGVRQVTRITGPCHSCGTGGGDVREWAYDDQGRIVAYTSGGRPPRTATTRAENWLGSAMPRPDHELHYDEQDVSSPIPGLTAG